MCDLIIEGVLASAPKEGVPVLPLDDRARPGEAEDSDLDGQSSESAVRTKSLLVRRGQLEWEKNLTA